MKMVWKLFYGKKIYVWSLEEQIFPKHLHKTNKEDMFFYEFSHGPSMGQSYEHHVMWIEAGNINSGGDDKVENMDLKTQLKINQNHHGPNYENPDQ